DGAGTHDESEASISSRLIERSTRVVVVADHTKIGADAFARIGSPEIIDDLVTDSAADPAVLDQLREAGIAVHIAEEGGCWGRAATRMDPPGRQSTRLNCS